MPTDAPRLLFHYLRAVGAGLLAQGALTLVFLAISDEGARRTHGILNHDARHGALHVLWGLALLILVIRERQPRPLVAGTIVFGLFYVALGILGILTHNPLGLRLGPGENGFHLIVGASALAAGGWVIWGAGKPAGSGLAARLNDG